MPGTLHVDYNIINYDHVESTETKLVFNHGTPMELAKRLDFVSQFCVVVCLCFIILQNVNSTCQTIFEFANLVWYVPFGDVMPIPLTLPLL